MKAYNMEQVTEVTYHLSLCEAYSKVHNKFCLYLSISSGVDWDDSCNFKKAFRQLRRAAPYLTKEQGIDMLMNHGWILIVCSSEKEMNKKFWQTVGDDGPTKSNPYNGKTRIYAVTIDPTLGATNENT
jgi:hypothetical protein